MKFLFFIVISFSLVSSGCSPAERLSRLAERHPELIRQIYKDSTTITKITPRPFTLHYEDTINFKIFSDTINFTVSLPKNSSPIDTVISSNDNIAHSRIIINDSIFRVKTWSTINQNYIHKDSVKGFVNDTTKTTRIKTVVEVKSEPKYWKYISIVLFIILLIIILKNEKITYYIFYFPFVYIWTGRKSLTI